MEAIRPERKDDRSALERLGDIAQTRKQTGQTNQFMPWLVTGVGAILGGIVFCLWTARPLHAKQIAGSIGWGSLPGVVILTTGLFLTLIQATHSAAAKSKLGWWVWLVALFLWGVVGAVVLIVVFLIGLFVLSGGWGPSPGGSWGVG